MEHLSKLLIRCRILNVTFRVQVLRRYSQKVYATPSRRKMDGKGETEEITYPHVCFTVDNFDEIFSEVEICPVPAILSLVQNFGCIASSTMLL